MKTVLLIDKDCLRVIRRRLDELDQLVMNMRTTLVEIANMPNEHHGSETWESVLKRAAKLAEATLDTCTYTEEAT